MLTDYVNSTLNGAVNFREYGHRKLIKMLSLIATVYFPFRRSDHNYETLRQRCIIYGTLITMQSLKVIEWHD